MNIWADNISFQMRESFDKSLIGMHLLYQDDDLNNIASAYLSSTFLNDNTQLCNKYLIQLSLKELQMRGKKTSKVMAYNDV